jgi:hypothetical protein
MKHCGNYWLTSKTAQRWGKPGWPERDNVRNWSNGENVKCAVDDVKRSLTQIFGDGQGNYPEGAYLDMVLIHTLHNTEEVDVLYEGLELRLTPKEILGHWWLYCDLRDGTTLPDESEKRKTNPSIGFSGHANPPAIWR